MTAPAKNKRENPENDPLGVGSLRHQSIVCSFLSLDTSSLERVDLATLLCFSTSPKEMWIDLAWSCFDACNCPCKALRCRSS
jgi:hypothetical protein